MTFPVSVTDGVKCPQANKSTGCMGAGDGGGGLCSGGNTVKGISEVAIYRNIRLLFAYTVTHLVGLWWLF